MASFSFVVISDHHLTEDESRLTRGFSTWSSFRAVLRAIARTVGSRIDFVVSLGDLVEPAPESTAFQFARQDDLLIALEPPHYRLVSIEDGILTSRLYEVDL